MGIDRATGAISQANKAFTRPNIVYKVAEVESIPLEDNTVDVIIASHVLYYVPDLQQAFKEMLRVLKDDGIIYLDGFARDCRTHLGLKILQDIFHLFPKDSFDWKMFVRLDEIQFFLDQYGFGLYSISELFPKLSSIPKAIVSSFKEHRISSLEYSIIKNGNNPMLYMAIGKKN